MKPKIHDYSYSTMRWIRAFAAIRDASRLARHHLVVCNRMEWECPDAVLSDDDIAAIHARQMGRTLAAIDELPEICKHGDGR